MRELALPLPLYGAVVVWLTWPLAAHLRTHLPDSSFQCQFDLLQMIWALAHQSHTFVTAPWKLADANIYYPARHAFFYGDAGFGALPYFMPTFLLTGNPALASNLTFLVSLALTASALHVVVHRWTTSHLAGLVAAWTFLTTRWVLWTWPASALNYAVLQYFPLIMYLAAAPVAGGGRTSVLLLLIVLQGLVTIYVAVPMLAGLGLIGVARMIRSRTRRAGWQLNVAVFLAGGVLLIANAGYFVVRAENLSILTQTAWGVARPNLQVPVGLLGPWAATAVPIAALVLIAVGGLSFVLRPRAERAARLASAWLHCVFWTVAGIVLTLTPVVEWYGSPIVLGSLAVSNWLPMLRRVDRLAVVGLMGLSVLSGLAFAECSRRLHRGRVFATWASPLLALLVVASLYARYAYAVGSPSSLGFTPLPSSYPLTPAITPSSLIMPILRTPGGPLLELPAMRLSGPALDAPANTRAMYRSIFHWRPLLNGYGGYWPAGFPERMALARELPDAEALAQLRRETRLELLLVHAGDFGRLERDLCARGLGSSASCRPGVGSVEHATWLDFAERGGRPDLRPIARDGDDLLFAVSDGSTE